LEEEQTQWYKDAGTKDEHKKSVIIVAHATFFSYIFASLFVPSLNSDVCAAFLRSVLRYFFIAGLYPFDGVALRSKHGFSSLRPWSFSVLRLVHEGSRYCSKIGSVRLRPRLLNLPSIPLGTMFEEQVNYL
jgi:hypothetical protein